MNERYGIPEEWVHSQVGKRIVADTTCGFQASLQRRRTQRSKRRRGRNEVIVRLRGSVALSTKGLEISLVVGSAKPLKALDGAVTWWGWGAKGQGCLGMAGLESFRGIRLYGCLHG